MALLRFVYVQCDTCQEACDGAGHDAYEARFVARQHGWTRRKSRDLCATCRQNRSVA